jgi:2-succinyl-5-enolpyruvyl-6-hydroxy-3-cyclohexene-1-carboxylate synthase
MKISFKAMSADNPGPVHLNVHLEEPLYEISTLDFFQKEEKKSEKEDIFYERASLIQFKEALKSAPKKLIILGMRETKGWNMDAFTLLSKRKDIVILCESVSNYPGEEGIWNADACIAAISRQEATAFIPDIVLTFGNQIVSKRVKSFLKQHKVQQHFDIAPGVSLARNWDMFDALQPFTGYTDEEQIIDTLLQTKDFNDSTFNQTWKNKSAETRDKSYAYFSDCPFSDLRVFETLITSFPDNANIQYGNSTPVRYSNLFPHKKDLTINANRGTSGIDGCVSTAAGAAYVNNRLTICVVGDISFFYDSNALWNNYLSENLRIIVINNGGGNIFRLIDGPTQVKDFEKFFETKHNLTAKYLASMYGLPYYICAYLPDNENAQRELNEILNDFYQPQGGKAAILEIITDGIVSADVYRKYFEYLRPSENEEERVEKHQRLRRDKV